MVPADDFETAGPASSSRAASRSRGPMRCIAVDTYMYIQLYILQLLLCQKTLISLGFFCVFLVDSLRCPAYCDENGFYRPDKWCFGDEDGVFCCGTLHHLYCCSNSTLAATDFPDASPSSCLEPPWWLFQYVLIIYF